MNRTVRIYSDQAEDFAARYERIPTEKVHENWLHLLPSLPCLVLDVGAGSGRDAAWLTENGHEVIAVEPADALRQNAQQLHPEPGIKWVNDILPDLKNVEALDLKYDLILLSAVWMHVKVDDRKRAMRKLVNLLKPGGLLVLTWRDCPYDDEREMFDTSVQDIAQLATQNTLEVVLEATSEDELGRHAVSWTTIVLRLPDDGTGALPLLRHVIINDAKASTYKLALMRVLLRIADGSQGAVMERNSEYVSIPFGLVAFYWVKAFMGPVLKNGLLQQPQGNGSLGFAKDPFLALKDVSPFDLRMGASFHGQRAKNLILAMRDARNTIKMMPAFYTTFPGSDEQVFVCNSNQVRAKTSVTVEMKFLSSFGTFQIPTHVWDAMTHYACWIEPAIVNEWASLMQGYHNNAGRKISFEDSLNALQWLDVKRETEDVRNLLMSLQEKGTPVYCVWTGQRLRANFEIDHCFPFAQWPNNDLWNLMPANPRVNNSKSDKLPTAGLLFQARDRICDWWDSAYGSTSLYDRFLTEAFVALPSSRIAEGDDITRVYSGLQYQRLRLKTDQQIAEWNG